MNIFAAAEQAKLNYRQVQRNSKSHLTGDVDELKAAKALGGCTCRGVCGSHTGPCTMKADSLGDMPASAKGKMCKACYAAINKKKK